MAQEKGYLFRRSKAIQLDRLIGSKQSEQREWSRPPGGGGSSTARLFMSPGGGIAARAGTTLSSATCTQQKIVSGTLTAEATTAAVYNPWPVAIPASYPFLAQKELGSGEWIALVPGVLDVRWVDPKLEQTSDGTTYTTIDTAVDCT